MNSLNSGHSQNIVNISTGCNLKLSVQVADIVWIDRTSTGCHLSIKTEQVVGVVR